MTPSGIVCSPPGEPFGMEFSSGGVNGSPAHRSRHPGQREPTSNRT